MIVIEVTSTVYLKDKNDMAEVDKEALSKVFADACCSLTDTFIVNPKNITKEVLENSPNLENALKPKKMDP